ncbi:aspartate 1-decarboxylase [Bradyrhizobium sp. CCBAU 65884]|uniref:aspartate 1-decarboxylase n=1 Tax=Bradyrhizobium sp. CCBAU 65884 TaxID=722477 RepID=UPI003FA49859
MDPPAPAAESSCGDHATRRNFILGGPFLRRKELAAKLHGIHVTEANLHYHGSITLDPDHCDETGILPIGFVEIWNNNSGARIQICHSRRTRLTLLSSTALLRGPAKSVLIVCSSSYLDEQQTLQLRPKISLIAATSY